MRIAARRHHARKFFAALLSLLTFLTIFPRRAALAQIATALKSEETFPRKAAARQPFRVETLGQIEDGTRPAPALWRQGFRTFPGRLINELFNQAAPEAPLADTTTRPEDKR